MAATLSQSNGSVIHIIHFNDVYDINETVKKDEKGTIIKAKGGAARFQTFINTLSPLKPIVLFSGDFLSPSAIGTVTRGEHMIPIMNGFGITCAMLGNHDLDFGVEHCAQKFSTLNFPVLCSNLLAVSDEASTDNVDADSKSKYESIPGFVRTYIHKYGDNVNVGFLGIAENFLNYLTVKSEKEYIYLDFAEECQKLVDKMRNDNKIDLMIVLTHMRLPRDLKLLSKIKGVDLICGGHDHMYYVDMNDDTKTMIVKSGSDFEHVSWMQIQLNKDTDDIKEMDTTQEAKKIEQELSKSLNEKKGPYKGSRYTFLNRYYNIDMNMKPHAETEKLVRELGAAFNEQAAQTIGYIAAPIDCRYSTVRLRESTAGNFVTDVIRRAYRCDCVLLNGGCMRADRILPAGKFTYRDILDLIPFSEPIMVMKMKGSTIVKVLEYAVGALPKTCGRYPQISGLRFLYDPNEPTGKRVKKVWIERYPQEDDERVSSFHQSMSNLKSVSKSVEPSKSNEQDMKNAVNSEEKKQDDEEDKEDEMEIIKEDEVYTFATREFLVNGGDGSLVIKQEALEIIIDQDAGIPPNVILRNFFWAIDSVNRLLKMSDDAEKQKEAKKRTRRFSLEIGGRRGSLITMEKSVPKQAKGLQDVDEKEQSEEEVTVDAYVDQLQIKPQIEHRSMTVDEQVDLESTEMKPMRGFFRRLPSFVGMEHLPRQQSLVDILDEIEQQNT